MVHYEARLDGTLAALADPTRRRVLELLGASEATITELSQPFGMSLTGMKKHVRILEEAELVSTEKRGRARLCRLGPRRLDDVQQWIDSYREMLDGRLDRLGELLASSPVAEEDCRRPASAGDERQHDQGEPQ
jgi:DNA-binding transcriptional ArsR family regulator